MVLQTVTAVTEPRVSWPRAFVPCRGEGRLSLREAAAERGISRQTAAKWVCRYREQGLAGLADRSSRPHRLRQPTPPQLIERVEVLCRQRLDAWAKDPGCPRGLRAWGFVGVSRAKFQVLISGWNRMAPRFRTPSTSCGLPGSGSMTIPRRCNLNPLIESPRLLTQSARLTCRQGKQGSS
jgi:transposase-like protein